MIGEEHLLVDRGRRVRDVLQGHHGALDGGGFWRIRPRR